MHVFEFADGNHLARSPQAGPNSSPPTHSLYPNLFSAHSASIRAKACRPRCTDIAHQPVVLLLRHELALAVSGAGVPILGR